MNYFNSLPLRLQLEQLSKCRFMDKSEFSNGVNNLKGKKVGNQVGILEGWGGYYMLEAIPAGIVGIMPGVPYCDLLDRVYKARKAGNDERAYDLFAALLPMMNFTLQDFELFLQVEKRILVRRGIFDSANLRQLTMTPSNAVLKHVEFLIDNLMRVFARESVAVS